MNGYEDPIEEVDSVPHMLGPTAPELLKIRAEDLRAHGGHRRERPGRLRRMLGSRLIGAGERVAGCTRARPEPIRRMS